MKRRKDIALKGALGLIAIILIMLFIQAPVQGACYTDNDIDSDCDGLKDIEETTIPQCSLGGQVDPIAIACNPGQKDLFVILLPCDDHVYNDDPLGGTCNTGQSRLPVYPLNPSPLQMLSNAANNLGITAHQIYPSLALPGTKRNVTATQKAVRILESKASSGVLGSCIPGTPNSTDDYCTVFTQKIYDTVNSLCGTKPCKDADNIAITKQQVIDKYIRHTIAHEIGHAMTLRAISSTDIGQHYPQINVILDSSVRVVNSGGGKKFYIGSEYYAGTDQQYAPNDKDASKLR